MKLRIGLARESVILISNFTAEGFKAGSDRHHWRCGERRGSYRTDIVWPPQ